ncbi:MAG: prepilin peptidase [Thermogutta sp.]
MVFSDVLLQIWWFVLGAVIGSFLNVVIYRLPRRESLIWPGSHCPKCGHLIRWYDNLPILSWLLLCGRCRDCRAAISIRYPVIEALSALTVGLIALAVSGGKWGAMLAVKGQAWYLSFLSLTVLQVLIYSSFFLTLMAVAAISWDGQFSPRLLWLPAWGLAFAGLLLQRDSSSGMASHYLAIPPMSWLHWGLALVVGSVCELLLGGWETNAEKAKSSPKRRRKKDRRAKLDHVGLPASETESGVQKRKTQTIDFISLAGLAAILFRPQTALMLIFSLLFLVLFGRVGSLMSRSRSSKPGELLRVRAIVLGIGFAANWIAVLLEITG